MSAVVVVEHVVAAPLSDAFARFIDFTGWSSWMPRTFSPYVGPERALALGDKFKVRVGRLPISLEVIRFHPNAEICWRGGSRLVMQGDHSYTFSEAAGETRIRSEEKLSGLLTLGPLSSRLVAAAAAETRSILERFAQHAARA